MIFNNTRYSRLDLWWDAESTVYRHVSNIATHRLRGHEGISGLCVYCMVIRHLGGSQTLYYLEYIMHSMYYVCTVMILGGSQYCSIIIMYNLSVPMALPKYIYSLLHNSVVSVVGW